MHCAQPFTTGRTLTGPRVLLAGDPIEVGAATAVMQGGGNSVRLTAAKSRIGHAEPAAGTVGILHVRSLPIIFDQPYLFAGKADIQ